MINTGTVVKNKRATFDYQILERFECGISLIGQEVKSIRNSKVNISDAFVRIIDGEAILWNAEISPYVYDTTQEYDPRRSRRLLLKRAEINYLDGKVKTANLTLIPLRIYFSRGKVKLEIGLAKGMKKRDKQRKIKERDLATELHREKRKYMVE